WLGFFRYFESVILWRAGLALLFVTLAIVVDAAVAVWCIRRCILPTHSLRAVWPWTLLLCSIIPLGCNYRVILIRPSGISRKAGRLPSPHGRSRTPPTRR